MAAEGTQTAALYIRVSTDDQTEFSPSAQKKVLLDYAKKNGYTVLQEHIFMDEGFSGKRAEKRPAFMKMIGMAKAGNKPFEVILVHKFDRFARSREDSVVYKSMLRRECGVKVISVMESLDNDDKMSVIIEAILEAMAEYYSINLAEEVKKGMAEKARRGGYQTTPPLGYRMEGDSLAPEEKEAGYIRYIFEQYIDYGRSPYQIARKLAGMGVKTKRGNSMDGRGVSYILQNPVYAGMVRWTPTEKAGRNFNHPDTIVVKGKHAPIISEERFAEAGHRFAADAQRRVPRARPAGQGKHWLSGIVKCSGCHATLSVATSLRYPSFQCSGYSKGKCLVSHGITVRKLEDAVLRELENALNADANTKYAPDMDATGSGEREIKLFNEQLSKTGDRLKRVNEAYLAGIYSVVEFKEMKERLELQKEGLRRSIGALKARGRADASVGLENRLSGLAGVLRADVDVETKQRALRGIVEKIMYDKANETLEVYYYDM